MKPHFAAAVTACLLLAGSAAPAFAAALDCPLPHPEAEPGVIQETPAMIRDFGDMLSSGTSGNDVGTVLQTLKQRFPKASDGELANFMISAYCPVLNAQGYDHATATAKLRRFSGLVEDRLFQTQ